MDRMDVWRSPEWFPVSIDPRARRMRFVRMSPETYRASVFLDARTHHLGEIRTAGMDELLRGRPRGPSRVHYIFHTAFCCSTLLARHLEALPRVLVLKEPGIL